MNKHTAGPWEVFEGEPLKSGDTHYYTIYSHQLGAAGRTDIPICTMAHNVRKINHKANARLIAAAPDMLAALHSVYRAIVLGNGRIIDWTTITDQIEAAIKKAEGKV